jgi:hypothetical protein
MERQDKLQLLNDIMTGELSIRKLKQQTVHFLLPENDGTSNVRVVTQFGTRIYTREQALKLFNLKGWNDDKAGKR